MIVYGDFGTKHVFRLQQLEQPVVVIFRVASLSRRGLSRLDKAARLFRQHKFVLVMRRTRMQEESISGVIHGTRRLKNVFLGVIEDVDDHRNIQSRRNELLKRLARRAKQASS